MPRCHATAPRPAAQAQAACAARAAAVAEARALCARLTPRQVEVLQLSARGLSATDVASMLGCTWRTVSSHREAILLRLEVNTMVEAAVMAAYAEVV